jgi:hypothetical protein
MTPYTIQQDVCMASGSTIHFAFATQILLKTIIFILIFGDRKL